MVPYWGETRLRNLGGFTPPKTAQGGTNVGEHWEDDSVRMQKGMLLLGWRADSRLTTDDEAQITPFVEEALRLQDEKNLTPEKIDRLSLKVYRIASFQMMNTEERAKLISGAYTKSSHLAPSVPLIDQATCCFFRGYYTPALATLFIVVESYLRNLYGWKPGNRDPSFGRLKSAVRGLPDSPPRHEALAVLDAMYSRYNAANPPQFYFNRHGLLHGLRSAQDEYDKMNCARVYLLLDLLCAAEGIDTGSYIFDGPDDLFYKRCELFEACLSD